MYKMSDGVSVYNPSVENNVLDSSVMNQGLSHISSSRPRGLDAMHSQQPSQIRRGPFLSHMEEASYLSGPAGPHPITSPDARSDIVSSLNFK